MVCDVRQQLEKRPPPSSLHSASGVEAYIRGSRIQHPPSHGGCTRGSKYARGFHIFILKYMFDPIFPPRECRIICGTICSSLRTQCVYFFHRKPSVTNQTHFRIYKHVRKSKNSSLSDRKLFQFQQTTPLEGTLATSGTIHTVKVNNIRACSVAEIFPPYTLYTRTRGRPF